MTKPYAVVSDLHMHAWSQFSSINADGTNSRLTIILDELERAGDYLLEQGGDHIYVAGDMFHVRGKIEPSVLNPTKDRILKMRKKGIEFAFIPGNHDLEGKDASRLSNAVTALESDGVTICQQPLYFAGNRVFMVPWHSNIEELKAEILKTDAHYRNRLDLIIHAPLNGVIMGIPDHGLVAAEVAEWGFRRVFCGHYHSHVEFPGGVYSIGATTHQTWGDVGSKAGFLVVYEDRVDFRASHAPAFVDLDPLADELTIQNTVDGNYVRVKLSSATEAEIKAIKESVLEAGARGVVVHAVKETVSIKREGVVKAGGVSLSQSVNDYVKAKYAGEDEKPLAELCEDILTESRSVEA